MTENMVEKIENKRLAQYLTFRLDNESYGIEVSQVREILDKSSITKVPRTPDYMLGVINLRGSVVPVIDLRAKFELGAIEKTRDTCIIVLEIMQDGEPLIIGTQSDSVQEVVDIASDQIEPPPTIGTSLDIEFIQGMAKHNDDFVMILNIDRIFSATELVELAQTTESEPSDNLDLDTP